MQTIKITIEQTATGLEFCNGAISVARITEYKNAVQNRFGLCVANKLAGRVDSLAMAVEVVSDKLEALFGSLGLNIEFN
ncbi:MAG: hypothetical protein HDT00_00305 [Bacteroidales bacterium]|nr:hypothetical protein [Bacteroidales bacterium]